MNNDRPFDLLDALGVNGPEAKAAFDEAADRRERERVAAKIAADPNHIARRFEHAG